MRKAMLWRAGCGLLILLMSGVFGVQGQSRSAVLKVPEGVMTARLVKRVVLRPPHCDMCAHVGGTVVLRVLVGKDGHVRRVSAISGPDMLKGAVIEAVRQWVYTPYLVSGVPTAVETTVSYVVDINAD